MTYTLKKNVASQSGEFLATTVAGVAITSGLSVGVSKDGAASSSGAGTLAHLQNGVWVYTFTQAETNVESRVSLIPSGASVQPTLATFPVKQFNATYELADHRVWKLRGTRESSKAPNLITLHTGFVGTLGVDFSEWLNPGTELDMINSVAATGLTFQSEAVSSADQTIAVFDITAGLTVGTHEITVTATTSDGDTLPATMDLNVE